jgi:hypothetical protein
MSSALVQEQIRHPRHFVDAPLTCEEDSGSQHALEQLRAYTLVYPPYPLLSDDYA